MWGQKNTSHYRQLSLTVNTVVGKTGKWLKFGNYDLVTKEPGFQSVVCLKYPVWDFNVGRGHETEYLQVMLFGKSRLIPRPPKRWTVGRKTETTGSENFRIRNSKTWPTTSSSTFLRWDTVVKISRKRAKRLRIFQQVFNNSVSARND